MIDEMDLDAVLICGPPELHAEAAPVALAGGCHVWVEVPAAPDADEAQSIATMAEERGKIAQAGLNARFAPVYRRMQKIVSTEEADERDFGELRSIEVVWWPPKTHGHDDPVRFDLIHALDMVRHLGGEVEDLSVVRGRDRTVLAIALELRSGAVATISFAAPAACPRERVAMASLQATVMATERREVMLRSAEREDTRYWWYDASRAEEGQAPWDPAGYIAQLQHFADAVTGEAAPEATLADAAAAMRLAERIAADKGS